MNTTQGFSLTEVLVSLVLIATTSLTLLKQQWQVSQLFNQIRLRTDALSQLDNASERAIVGASAFVATKPFQFDITPADLGLRLQISWTPSSSIQKEACILSRLVVIK